MPIYTYSQCTIIQRLSIFLHGWQTCRAAKECFYCRRQKSWVAKMLGGKNAGRQKSVFFIVGGKRSGRQKSVFNCGRQMSVYYRGWQKSVGSGRQKSVWYRRQKSAWAWAVKESFQSWAAKGCLAKGGKDSLLSNAAIIRGTVNLWSMFENQKIAAIQVENVVNFRILLNI